MADELNLIADRPTARELVQGAIFDRSDGEIIGDLSNCYERDRHQVEKAAASGEPFSHILFVRGEYLIEGQTRSENNELVRTLIVTDLSNEEVVAKGEFNLDTVEGSIEIAPEHRPAVALAFMPVTEQALLLAQIEREQVLQFQPTVAQIDKNGLQYCYGESEHGYGPEITINRMIDAQGAAIEPEHLATYLEADKCFLATSKVPVRDTHIHQQLNQTITDLGLDVSVEANRMKEPDLSQLSLGELFKQADAIGDKYLTPDEITTRDQALADASTGLEDLIQAAVAEPASVVPSVQSEAQPTPAQPITKSAMETSAHPPAEVKSIALDALLSQSSQDAMRGITGIKSTYNPTLKRKETEPRSPGEAFRNLAQGAYGAENFCRQHDISVQGSADYIINKSALELDIPPEFIEKLLSDINREECVPAVQAASGSDLPVWKRVNEQAPGTYEAKAPEPIKSDLATDKTMLASAKAATLSRMGVTLKPREPAAQSKAAGYEPAPSTPATKAATTFRDSLSMSNLREWETSVRVAEPFNTDKIQGIQDFSEKFQRTGYQMSDGGISVGMATRLEAVQQTMQLDVTALRDRITESVQSVLSQAPEDTKGKRTVEAPKLGLKFQGDKEGNFTVKSLESGKLLALRKDGDITINPCLKLNHHLRK